MVFVALTHETGHVSKMFQKLEKQVFETFSDVETFFGANRSYIMEGMNNVDSKEVIGRIVGGDSAAFEALVKQYEKLVWHIVSKLLSSESDREDICQEVFLKVYRKLSTFQGQSKLSTWIGRIAYNTSLNFLEKKRPVLFDDLTDDSRGLDSLASDQESPDDFAQAGNLSDLMKNVIDQLPQKYSLIISMYHLQDMTYEEIGKVTGLPAGTVKSHLFRARKLLKEKIVAKYSKEEICPWNI